MHIFQHFSQNDDLIVETNTNDMHTIYIALDLWNTTEPLFKRRLHFHSCHGTMSQHVRTTEEPESYPGHLRVKGQVFKGVAVWVGWGGSL